MYNLQLASCTLITNLSTENLPFLSTATATEKDVTTLCIIFFCVHVCIGAMRAPPSQLLRVCVGPSLSLVHQGRLNISWDPLPCYLQNGADIFRYTIQYTRLSTGVATNISSSDSRLICRQESGGPYSCVAAPTLFIPRVTYSFQVAAQNNFGVGSFSNPVIFTIGSLGRHTILMLTITDLD